RAIEILPAAQVYADLGLTKQDDLKVVGYRSTNQLTNKGTADWQKQTGLLSIWLLGMFNPSATTTVVIPYVEGDESALGPIVNDSYFGKVPDERLKVGQGVIYFSGDGKYRSKIGLPPG